MPLKSAKLTVIHRITILKVMHHQGQKKKKE